MYKFKYPIQRGLIQNEEEMEILWKFLLNKFNVSPKENQILLTEPMNSDKSKKKSITEIMLEKYQFSSLAFSKQGVLPLFALGMTSGTVVQSGEGLTQIVPIFDGFSKDECWTQINFGGKQVTLHLRDLMRKIGVNMDTSAELEEVRQIKQKICMKEQKESEKTQYVLPDGKKVSFSSTEKLAPEILFNPSKIGLDFPSLPQILVNALEKVDLDLQFELFNNIVLSGGNTMFENFSMKFIESLRSILPDLNNCRVKDVPKRDVLCWQGANILADHSLFSQINITPQEYKEHGDSIFLKKKF